MKTLRLLLLIPTILLLGGLGFYSYHHAQAYEESRAALAAQSDAAGRAQQKLDSLTSTITFGLIEDESQTARDTLRAQQEQHHTRSLTSLYAFVALLMLLILVGLFCSPTVYALILATGSLVSLILGLISPILMITIHKQINYLGDVVLSFESKSI
ncbi:MAG TPA: hypothetical protein ENK86_04530, partial [Campylobacterales bacterium]|nr:hypothetical protein [Campylobacterales bacterium]